ncbi:AraC-like DNA-binding protein [Acinetobacter sp. BIGb0102]|uniref:AraC family transcriptional regulator n=1 Tax=Acinetobacter TaxID=469 RepID=UPI000F4F577C|nr:MULTISPECIES: AraC family transcriptional regulator [Acinetobacter]MBJ8482499.1 AraC family transcriptional regulator [Acinetobacter vivianii]RPE30736.1 AraC-like DNA-binding protein [Acinetobacter sp. BIGb0102]
MPQTATALTSWVKAIQKALEKAGCDSKSLIEQAGLDIQALNDPNARYSLQQTARLWQLATAATQDSCFGLKVANQVNQHTFHVLGHSLATSTTLKEMFIRIIRYFRLVTDIPELEFYGKDQNHYFIIHVPDEVQYESIDAFISVFIRSCRALQGSLFSPLRIELRRSEPSDLETYRSIIKAPLIFNAPQDMIVFDTATIELPLEGANPILSQEYDEIIMRYLARFDKENIQARIKVKIIENLAAGEIQQQEIAKSLGLSTRSLQRKLSLENTSYSEILDKTRQELASSYIKNNSYSITEIAYILGFTDVSSFTRAFRRWTDCSPLHYRENLSKS